MTGLQIFIRHIDDRMTEIEVPLDAKVKDLYKLTSEIICGSRLSFSGTTLNDMDELLADIGVTQEAVVNVVQVYNQLHIDKIGEYQRAFVSTQYSTEDKALYTTLTYIKRNDENDIDIVIGLPTAYISKINGEVDIPNRNYITLPSDITLSNDCDLNEISLSIMPDPYSIIYIDPKFVITNVEFKEELQDMRWRIKSIIYHPQ